MHPFNLSGRIADSPRVEGPTYPTQSSCWFCGTTVLGSPSLAMRSCENGHERVTWQEKLPNVNHDWRPVGPENLLSSPA